MSKIDELQKAIDEAAMAGVLMIRKSQMSFDFTASNPHHVAYTRTNASGTVSNIQAKGSERYKVVKLDNGRHGVKDTLYKYNVATGMDKDQAHQEATSRNARHKEARAREDAEEARLNAASQPAAKGSPKYQPGDTVIHHGKKQTLVRRNDANGMARWELSNSGLMYEGDEDKHIPAPRGPHNPESPDYTHVGDPNKPAAKEVKPNAKQKVWGGTDSADGKFRFRDWETGNEVPNYEGEYTYFSKDGDKSQMHTWIDKYGERNHSHMTKDQYNAKYGEDFGRETPHKIGDTVHLGFGTKGGAGFVGKLTKIEDGMAYIKNDEGRTFKGHVSKLSKP